ncbi:hypothetical protein LOZ65_000851 [Ophidiomyces ophidiicola]|nr:hypothetical protein LOZ65_000851 [Ophidiomyces ophidiicola]
MRFTRLKRAIESGALNIPTGAILTGMMEGGSGLAAAGSHGKGKAAANKSGGRAKSASKVRNSKMTTTTTGRNPGDAAAAACRQRKASVKLETAATGREEHTANKETILQRQACEGDENNGDYDDDDDDDVPLAIKRRMALSTKRPAAADLAAERKRRKMGSGSDECSLSRVGGITSDVEIIAVAPVTAAAAGSGSSNGWGAAAFTTMGGRDETLFRELPLRPWPGHHHHQHNKNKNSQGWRLAQEHAVTSSDPPVPPAPLLARASDPAEQNNKNHHNIASSPGDTISLASSSSSSLMDRPFDNNNNAGLPAWRPARVPQIVITDMEPHAPRNWLNPRSAAAIGKAEQAVNLALFGPGSQAFRRVAAVVVPGRGRGEGGDEGEGERAGEAVRRYLAVPWSAVEENPRRAREYIVIE